MDDLIRNAELQLKLLTEDKRYAYVSYQVGYLPNTYLSNICYLFMYGTGN